MVPTDVTTWYTIFLLLILIALIMEGKKLICLSCTCNNSNNKQANKQAKNLKIDHLHYHYAWDMCSQHSIMPVQAQWVWDSQWDSAALDKLYPAQPCRCSNLLLLGHDLFWLAHCLSSLLYHQQLVLMMLYWVPFNTSMPLIKECLFTLLCDFYCHDYMVKWSFLVNIHHYFFAKWPRSWREEL